MGSDYSGDCGRFREGLQQSKGLLLAEILPTVGRLSSI